MRKIRAFCIILCFILAMQWINVHAVAASDDISVTSGCHSVDAARTLSESKKLVETSKAVILYDLNTDTLL